MAQITAFTNLGPFGPNHPDHLAVAIPCGIASLGTEA
jgi:hypothetical protein